MPETGPKPGPLVRPFATRLLSVIDNPRNGPRVVIGFAAIVILGIWLSVSWYRAELRQAIMSSAEQELRGAALALGSHARRTIEAVNANLHTVDSWLFEASRSASPPPLGDLVSLIGQLQSAVEDPVDIRPIDQAGFLFRFATGDNFRAFVGDRPYVQALEGTAPGTLYLSEPLVSRDSGRKVMPIAIHVRPNAYGIKYLVAAVTIRQFENAYRNLLISAPGRIGILRSDGMSLVTVPDDNMLATREGIAFQQQVRAHAAFEPVIVDLPSASPGRTAVAAILALKHQPALIYAAFDREALLDRWWAESRPQIIAGIVATCMVALIAAWLLHVIRLNAHEAHTAIEAMEAANAANAAKRQFLANMSHELRTPLNAILGFSDVISGAMLGPLGAHYQSYGGDIGRSGRHLLQLVDQLLDISRIESGDVRVLIEPLDLRNLIDESLGIALQASGRKDLHCKIDCQPGAARIHGDRGILRQVFTHLLSNAAKFNRKDGRIEVLAKRRDGAIEITIADNGEGIAPAQLARLFEPFRKEDAGIAQRPGQGIGLGLAIVHGLLKTIGGHIRIQSQPGQGTVVTIDLAQSNDGAPTVEATEQHARLA